MRRKALQKKLFRLDRLDEEVRQRLEELRVSLPLLIGALSEVNRTCGKPTCHCAQKPAHRFFVLMTTEYGRRRCQVVRRADVKEVTTKVERYRRFRSLLRRLKRLDFWRYALLKGILEDRHEPYD